MKRKTVNKLKSYGQPKKKEPVKVDPRKAPRRRQFKVAPDRWKYAPEPHPPIVGSVGGLTRVLVACPLYELFDEALDAIFRVRWPGWVDYFFPAENPNGDSFADIQHQYTKCREVFLRGNYDALFTVESDVIVPGDALVKLAETEAPIAYGIYACRYGGEHRGKWSAYVNTHADGRPRVSVSQKPGLARQWWGTVQPVTGVGLGCTLVRRAVLEGIELVCTEAHHPDTNLAREANRRGIQQVAHFGVICGHIMRDVRGVLWPDPARDEMYSIIPRQCRRRYVDQHQRQEVA